MGGASGCSRRRSSSGSSRSKSRWAGRTVGQRRQEPALAALAGAEPVVQCDDLIRAERNPLPDQDRKIVLCGGARRKRCS